MGNVSLEFTNLPLVEVTARWSLAQPLPLSTTFLHDLLDELPPGYSDINDIDRMTPPPGVSSFEFPLTPMPLGITADHDSDGTTLRVERQLLAITWQSREDEISGSRAYPRFKSVLLPGLIALKESVERIIGEEGVKPIVANMFYSNLIETQEEPTFGDLLTYLDSMTFGPIQNENKLHDINLSWRNGDLVDLRIQCRASSVSNQTEQSYGFSLVTSGGTAFDDPKLCVDKISIVHSSLSGMFSSLITDEANRRWARADA